MYNYNDDSHWISVGNMKKAAACTETYLMFLRNDEVMSSNKMYYLKQRGVILADFTVIQVGTYHVTRQVSSFPKGTISNNGVATRLSFGSLANPY